MRPRREHADAVMERRLGVARIDADHGEAGFVQRVEQPARQLAALEPDPCRMRRVAFHRRRDSFWRCVCSAVPYDLAGIVNTQIDVSFRETSRPTKWLVLDMVALHWRCGDQHATSPAITPCPDLILREQRAQERSRMAAGHRVGAQRP